MSVLWSRCLAVVALLASVWALAVWLTGGFAVELIDIRVSSRQPLPAVAIAILSATASIFSSAIQDRRRAVMALWAVVHPARAASLLSVVTLLVALIHNGWTASGSDAYSYVTQADLWLRGSLRIPVPIAQMVPWPSAIATFTPFGYTSTPDHTAIVPVTAPGFPLLMAAMQAIAGHCAMFLVAPLTGALLVWTTFAIGRRVGSDGIGLAAAWLVATSPTFLMMAKAPMSDVPAAAFWALATLFVLHASVAATIGAGSSAAVAILVRPNLVPLAALFGLWILWRHSSRGWRHGLVRALWFSLGVIPACLIVGWINHTLYGSPLASGYGALNTLFALTNVPTNVSRYGSWLVETQTPLAIAGVLVLLIPTARIWVTNESRRAAVLLALLLVGVWVSYCAYPPFDAWWYLRFLLPCWPAVCVGTAAAIIRPAVRFGGVGYVVAAVLVVALGINGVVGAVSHNVFPSAEGERRYATVASFVATVTEPSSVILTSQHSGPLRYYGGRLTLRFDALDAEWLDRAVEWLTQAGRHPYFLIEDWELPLFRDRFAARNRLGRLELSPLFAYAAYQIPGTVYLFDPLQPAARTWQPLPIRDPRPRCVAPAVSAWLDVHRH